jgi:hypothetical protein
VGSRVKGQRGWVSDTLYQCGDGHSGRDELLAGLPEGDKASRPMARQANRTENCLISVLIHSAAGLPRCRPCLFLCPPMCDFGKESRKAQLNHKVLNWRSAGATDFSGRSMQNAAGQLLRPGIGSYCGVSSQAHVHPHRN